MCGYKCVWGSQLQIQEAATACLSVLRAAKERRKPDRVVFECQERAYWVVHRPPVRTHTHLRTHAHTHAWRGVSRHQEMRLHAAISRLACRQSSENRRRSSSSLAGFPIISSHEASAASSGKRSQHVNISDWEKRSFCFCCVPKASPS